VTFRVTQTSTLHCLLFFFYYDAASALCQTSQDVHELTCGTIQNPETMENGYLDHGGEEPDFTALNHKRNLSGGILARLPFLRSSLEERNPNHHYANNFTPDTGDASMTAVPQLRSRKRKGSLRKTALLGTGKRRLERRTSKSNSNDLNRSPPHSRNAGEYSRDSMETVRGGPNGMARSTSSRYSFEDGESAYAGSSTITTSSSNWPLTAPAALGIEIDTTLKEHLHQSPPSSVTSPITNHPYTSTTDDDEGLTLAMQTPLQPPPPPHLARTRSSRAGTTHASSSAAPLRSAAPSPQHDYSETEWWGWTILLLTWIVFVVGMGSCLGVWSWAWDVGETPYAPPELEDDPTLPIVGYYPALIVLTGVAAWVWVVVAWVGMKYFRHARVWDGDD